VGSRVTVSRRLSALCAAVATAVVVAAPTGSAAAPAADPDRGTDPLVHQSDVMLTRHPHVGRTFVVDLAGVTPDHELLARTLQGVVNRSEARLYLVDSSPTAQYPGSDERVLDLYVREGLVDVAGRGSLEDALARYTGEVPGYVVADPAVDWSVNVATTVAASRGAVVATAATAPVLDALGIPEIDDVRGRYPNEVVAYWATAAAYRGRMDYKGLANQRPTLHAARDLYVQQGIFTLYTRPHRPSFLLLTMLTGTFPRGLTYYGYVSDTGPEEIVAVGALSILDQRLVPSDSATNMSFHLAVGADRPRAVVAPPDHSGVAPCTPDTVNVVIGITDGDNVVTSIKQFQEDRFWPSPRRGDLPLGWSMSPNLAVLAPALWDHYVRSATAADELVGMLGVAYQYPVVNRDARRFLEDSFALDDRLGMHTFWTLEPLGFSWWPDWYVYEAAAAAGHGPHLFLSGYDNLLGLLDTLRQPAIAASPGGTPVLVSMLPTYGFTSDQHAELIRDLVATPPAQRPRVTFFAATNWTTDVDGLVAALAPLRDEGVRFLTPGQATACMGEGP